MAVYEYLALDEHGKRARGIIDADTQQAARRRLREMGLHPTSMAETGETVAVERDVRSRMKLRRPIAAEVCLVTRQLAVLLAAGMQLVEALSCVLDQIDHPRLTKVVFNVRERVRQGAAFADALAAHPKEFNDLYVNMVRAGEKSGALDIVLARLADYLENQARLTSRVRSASVYPTLMIVFGGLILTFLMAVVVPKIAEMFDRMNQQLPAVTNLLLGVSDFVHNQWYILAAVIVIAVVGGRRYIHTETGRRVWHRVQLRLPVFGELTLKMAVSRFARTLGTLLEGGLSMLGALDIVKGLVRNAVIETAIDDTQEAVRTGQDLAGPLRRAEVFPPMLIHMVALGERSGQLEQMLIKVADTYDEDVDTSVDTLVSLLEPVIIIVMGFVVGFIVLAILLPIFDMSQHIM